MRRDSSSDVAASEAEDERSITAVADEPAVTRERAPEIAPGDVLAGRYQIEAVIGKGGSGIVVRAFDRVSTTVVAVKILKAALTHDPRWEKRFQRELRLGRPIQHPNVCRIFDIGDADGYRFLTMEYAKGGTLRDLIKKDLPLRPLSERLKDAADAIAGLAAIHAAGIVHRDVKPDNMLRADDGRLVLSDFGLATDLPDNTMVSVFVGTPHYMAPEVREGDPATARSDVWSLGVVLHEVFFGKRPERRASRTAPGVSMGSTTSSLIERAMLALCLRCLADDPAERPESATAVMKLFESAHRSPGALIWSRARRRSLYWVVGTAALSVLVALGAYGRWRSRTPVSASEVRIPRLVNTGQPTDWTNVAKIVASVPGHVHCFLLVGPDTVRLIWGSPRKAEDVEISSGTRRPASLVSEAYATGCPDLSHSRRELLFTASTAVGGAEIRHSTNPDGRDSKPVTPGSDPVWLMNDEEFAYTIDSTHASVFSLPTMKFRLLPDPDLGTVQSLLGKAVSSHAEGMAVMFYVNDVQWAVALYEGPGLKQRVAYAIPGARNFRFAPEGDRLFVSPIEARSPLAALDWRKGNYQNIGRYADMDLIDVLVGDQIAAIVGRRRSRDAWLYEGSKKRRLTSDGENDAAAISVKGELLLARPGPRSTENIWSRSLDGALRQVTNGQFDTTPDFSPDGNSWIYADYAGRGIMICTKENRCRLLRRDEILPTWPRFSPDGSKVAYVRNGTISQLMVFSVSDGKEWPMGATHWQCPPVWSSPSKVWAFEGSAGGYEWVEKEIETGLRTGRHLQVTDRQMAVSDELECWPNDVDDTSAFFRKVRVETEETSSILRLPLNELAR
ncbi:MAG TPA: protein kinase [Polyangia bacterium]|nr:protein kinase [Polyangia bacterium]